MPRHEAIKALEIYKRAGQQVMPAIYLINLIFSWIYEWQLLFTYEIPLTWRTIFGFLMQAGSLSDFYDVCKGLELARNFQFPVLREVLRLWWWLNSLVGSRSLSFLVGSRSLSLLHQTEFLLSFCSFSATTILSYNNGRVYKRSSPGGYCPKWATGTFSFDNLW